MSKRFCFTIQGKIFCNGKPMSAYKIYKINDKNIKNEKGAEGDYLNQIIDLMEKEFSIYFKKDNHVKDFEFLLKPGDIENPILFVYSDKSRLSADLSRIENLEHEVTTEGMLTKKLKSFYIYWDEWTSC